MEKLVKELVSELSAELQKTYEEGTTLDDAEKLASKCLQAQLVIAAELSRVDLNSRARKSGLKAIKAAVYLDEATKTERKPSDVMLEAMVNKSSIVQTEQDRFDESEVNKNELEHYLSIFRESHIYYRGVSRGRFE